MWENLQMTDFTIIANGPFLYRQIIKEAMQGKKVIALDGALNKLRWCHTYDIDYILGDFDSVDSLSQQHWGIRTTFQNLTEDSTPYNGSFDVRIVPALNQNYTDLEKAIDFCDTQGASSITILCASGGRQDHDIAVKQAMKKAYRPDRLITLHTNEQSIRFARDEAVEIIGQPGDYCGFISSVGHCSSEDLKHTCNCHQESFCNQLTKEKAILNVTGEAMVILPPMLASQREFMSYDELEQLSLLHKDAENNAIHYDTMNFFHSFS